MLKKLACIGLSLMIVLTLSGCGKGNKINEYDKENKMQVSSDEELIRDADYSEGNLVVPYINIDSSEVDEVNKLLCNEVERIKDNTIKAFFRNEDKIKFNSNGDIFVFTEEANDEKFYIDNMNYSYFLDDRILSILVEQHSSDGNGYDSCFATYNIDLHTKKLIVSEYVINKLLDEEQRKKIDKYFLEEFERCILLEITKNPLMSKYYNDYDKERAISQYIKAMDTYDVSIYVGENKKINIIIPCTYIQGKDHIKLETDIDVDKLFEEDELQTSLTNEKNIPILKSKVLDYAISDYKALVENEEFVYNGFLENEDKIPNDLMGLYGRYLPHFGTNGIGGDSIEYAATSTLIDDKYNYNVLNLADEFNKDNSWVEGKKGYGIGEKIVLYTMYGNEFCKGNMLEGYGEFLGEEMVEKDNYNASLNGIYIVNGYVQNEDLYKANSRVKKLKLTIDDKDEYILELEDTMMPQIFDVDYKVTYAERIYPIKAEFQILEVYKGSKYDDTAINTLLVGADSDVMSGGR